MPIEFEPTAYIKKYLESQNERHSRLKAWEFIYEYIWHENCQWNDLTNDANLDKTALHIGFYLANWGMFRGSSALLLHNNLELFRELAVVLFTGAGATLHNLSLTDFAPYEPNLKQNQATFNEVIRQIEMLGTKISWTDTLKSKILMGTWGECPALDTYYTTGRRKLFPFVRGLSEVSGKGMTSVYNLIYGQKLKFPTVFTLKYKYSYPPGKLLDMALFQYGFNPDL